MFIAVHILVNFFMAPICHKNRLHKPVKSSLSSHVQP